MWDFIKSDLYRYYGNTHISTFLRAFLRIRHFGSYV